MTVLCGITLGRYSFVGAGAVVTHDVPDFALVYGNPAKLMGWICRCGISLASITDPAKGTYACESCERTYSREGDRLVRNESVS